MNNKWKVAAVLALVVGAGLAARPVLAHGFGQTYALPIPLSYFIVAAAATVALSFVVVGAVVQSGGLSQRYPTHDLLRHVWFQRTLASTWFLALVRAVSVFLFLLALATAFGGTNRPLENFSPTFVWILWWVGFGYIAAILGNLWAVVNPWKITYEWGERLVALFSGPRRGKPRREQGYPKGWDVWPAAVLFLVFAWIENVYTAGSVPQKLGILVVVYSLITWGGMLMFGKRTWLARGEAFSVLFGFFSRFSPTEVRVTDTKRCRTCELECVPFEGGCVDCYACFEDSPQEQRQFNLRPFSLGLARPDRISVSTLFFVVLALATVTFDGLNETSAWNSVRRVFIDPMGAFGGDLIDTLGLLAVPAAFLVVYLAFSWLMKKVSGVDGSVWRLARIFVFSLVPIALAYNVAHYITLLAVQGQLIIPLISDPFGFGWNLFGTAGYRLNLFVVNAKFVWFMSISVIVVAHVVAVYVAHLVALREIPDQSKAVRSQYPMLVLMVAYTAVSLWLIAQPLVTAGGE
ncbi:MAG: hypothetical protein FJ317_04005 [SAR202 cluster bacterium]|nr:hypothetical protein [SAR202 cluster bacterium]